MTNIKTVITRNTCKIFPKSPLYFLTPDTYTCANQMVTNVKKSGALCFLKAIDFNVDLDSCDYTDQT